MKIVYALSLFLIIACQEGQMNKVTSQESINEKFVKPVIGNTSLQTQQSIIEGAIGVIVTSETYQFGDKINILDKKGGTLKQVIISEENQVLNLRCLSRDSSFYKVRLENKDIGFISCNEKGVSFQTWEEHVLSVFAVEFDEDNNPLLKNPLQGANKAYYDADEFYYPSQIKGEWLQVKWGSEASWEYGWIKWKDGGKFLVRLFYFA